MSSIMPSGSGNPQEPCSESQSELFVSITDILVLVADLVESLETSRCQAVRDHRSPAHINRITDTINMELSVMKSLLKEGLEGLK